jgi:hypothetical protein
MQGDNDTVSGGGGSGCLGLGLAGSGTDCGSEQSLQWTSKLQLRDGEGRTIEECNSYVRMNRV